MTPESLCTVRRIWAWFAAEAADGAAGVGAEAANVAAAAEIVPAALRFGAALVLAGEPPWTVAAAVRGASPASPFVREPPEALLDFTDVLAEAEDTLVPFG